MFKTLWKDLNTVADIFTTQKPSEREVVKYYKRNYSRNLLGGVNTELIERDNPLTEEELNVYFETN